eukprot:scaffold24048_cov194-Amphora_coffeaeformis.AAC.18
MTSPIDFSVPNPAPLDHVKWIHGSVSAKHNTDPDIQVHHYNDHTVILRQNKAVHYEAPFMFLLFGTKRCILLDTGSTKSPAYFPLRATVDTLIDEWKAKFYKETDDGPYTLVVAHTHLHRDHYEGDAQFEERPDTVQVEKSLAGTQAFYGFTNWPHDMPVYDLGGGRTLTVIATPGHEDAEVTLYDAYSQILLTGDLVLPGRLYVRDWSDFVASIDRLVAFCQAHSVRHLVGCHIEMSKYPTVDYLIRTTYQPHERALPMTVDQLLDVQAAVRTINGQKGHHVFDDFHIVYPPPERYFAYENMDDLAQAGDACQACRLEREGKFMPPSS